MIDHAPRGRGTLSFGDVASAAPEGWSAMKSAKRRQGEQVELDEAQRLADRELLEAALAPYSREPDEPSIDLRSSLRGAPTLRLRRPSLLAR